MKIDGNMTLFELKEHCTQTLCSKCEFMMHKNDGTSPISKCVFTYYIPSRYGLYKPKTYKEDFLEKFPNAVLSTYEHRPQTCVGPLYGEKHRPPDCETFMKKYSCVDCWNRVMREEE